MKAFIAEHLTPEIIASTHDGTIHNWDFHRQLAERQWARRALFPPSWEAAAAARSRCRY